MAHSEINWVRVAHPPFRNLILFLYSFRYGREIVRVEPKGDFSFRFVTGDCADEVEALRRVMDPAQVDIRFENRHVCCAAKDGSQIVAYAWISFSRQSIDELFKVIRLRSDEIYLYDAFTSPQWRGKNLYPAILTRILANYSDRGLKRALIFTTGDNIPSQRGITRAGFSLFQKISCRKLLLLCRYQYGDLLSREDQPVLLERWSTR